MLEANLHARLEIDPSDLAALAELKRIYASSERWTDWLDIQQRLIDLETEVDRLAVLLQEIVIVCRDQLGDDERAEDARQRLRDLGLCGVP